MRSLNFSLEAERKACIKYINSVFVVATSFWWKAFVGYWVFCLLSAQPDSGLNRTMGPFDLVRIMRRALWGEIPARIQSSCPGWLGGWQTSLWLQCPGRPGSPIGPWPAQPASYWLAVSSGRLSTENVPTWKWRGRGEWCEGCQGSSWRENSSVSVVTAAPAAQRASSPLPVMNISG